MLKKMAKEASTIERGLLGVGLLGLAGPVRLGWCVPLGLFSLSTELELERGHGNIGSEADTTDELAARATKRIKTIST